MAENSKIEWTESTWNPVTGCTKISDGCANCYAEKLALRLKEMGQKKYSNGFNITLHPETINEPLKWKKPRMVFVCSMSDLFHKDIPSDFILKVFKTMNNAGRHIFQVLTKRPQRLLEIRNEINWTDNIWIGTTVESEKYAYRIKYIKDIPARVKFLSLEPLLSSVGNISLDGIDWVIVGGESGPVSRPVRKEWITDIKDRCEDNGIPFFFKQWGGVNRKKAGKELDGRTFTEIPVKQTACNDYSTTGCSLF
ncbi:MAG: phage Gp37/Gp68 family protein [Deltaproteobacteria bacterium]|jgi:protein gp37|nr:phage Gp37/Gp68 family protein [Deltaproteobacteria bacterium]